MPQKDQLVLQHSPKGEDLNRSARSDLTLPPGARAYQQTIPLSAAGHRQVRVVLHFVGSLTEVQSGTLWKLTKLQRSDVDRKRGEFHYQLEARPHWTANADTITLNERANPVFLKRCQRREKVGATAVRPAVPALSK